MASRREIIDRIEKLYALASGGTSPGEAAAATAMAQKLAKKHGIQDSEINKHTYTRGTKSSSSYKRRPEESRQQSRSYSYRKAWEDSSSQWEDYQRWSKQKEEQRRKDYDDFTRNYYQHTFNPEFVYADKLRETAKAVLLNVYLDPSKYPWSPLPVVVVSSWIPKSQVTAQFGKGWLLNKALLLKNLRENVPWLLEHHPVFKGQHHIEFHFKAVV